MQCLSRSACLSVCCLRSRSYPRLLAWKGILLVLQVCALLVLTASHAHSSEGPQQSVVTWKQPCPASLLDCHLMAVLMLMIAMSMLHAAPKQVPADASSQGDSQADSPQADRPPSAGPVIPALAKPLPMPPMLVSPEQQQAAQMMLQAQQLQQIAENVIPLHTLQPGGKPAAAAALMNPGQQGICAANAGAGALQESCSACPASCGDWCSTPAPAPAVADDSHGHDNPPASSAGGSPGTMCRLCAAMEIKMCLPLLYARVELCVGFSELRSAARAGENGAAACAAKAIG